MTLAQWLEARGLVAIATKSGAKGIFCKDATPELWRLDDYLVSSNIAGVYWLVPKEKKS